MTDAALGSLELEPLLDELLRRLTDILDIDTAAAVLLDERDRGATFQVAAGTPAQRRPLEPAEQELLARLEALGEAMVVRDAR